MEHWFKKVGLMGLILSILTLDERERTVYLSDCLLDSDQIAALSLVLSLITAA